MSRKSMQRLGVGARVFIVLLMSAVCAFFGYDIWQSNLNRVIGVEIMEFVVLACLYTISKWFDATERSNAMAQTHEPLTSERLAEIRAMLDEIEAARARMHTFAPTWKGEREPAPTLTACHDLLAEVDRLQAALAAAEGDWKIVIEAYDALEERMDTARAAAEARYAALREFLEEITEAGDMAEPLRETGRALLSATETGEGEP